MASQLGTTTWKVTLKRAFNAVAKWRTRRLTNFIRFPHLNDHQVKTEDLEIVGESAETCFQIVLNVCVWQELERPDLLRTVNYLARSVTKWNRVCDL